MPYVRRILHPSCIFLEDPFHLSLSETLALPDERLSIGFPLDFGPRMVAESIRQSNFLSGNISTLLTLNFYLAYAATKVVDPCGAARSSSSSFVKSKLSISFSRSGVNLRMISFARNRALGMLLRRTSASGVV